MQESLHCPPPNVSIKCNSVISKDGGRRYFLDHGWRDGVFHGPWVEGGGILWDPGWREEVDRGTLDGGRRNSVGPWMEGGGKPWTLEKARSIFLL